MKCDTDLGVQGEPEQPGQDGSGRADSDTCSGRGNGSEEYLGSILEPMSPIHGVLIGIVCCF